MPAFHLKKRKRLRKYNVEIGMENTICVIGGANIDICGSSLEPLKNYDSNPGTIAVSYGGVGRNIAQICALLKQKTKFITVFSNDEYGQMMRQDCEALGMDTSDCVVNEQSAHLPCILPFLTATVI
jgi:sugar/nucleoside kinase (ribokinase family)